MPKTYDIKNIDYKRFIEDNFAILDYEKQQPVPFRFDRGPTKKVQDIYYDILTEEYPRMEGMREIILKARREGMSSVILAIFTVDFLLRPYSKSICISHRRDATENLFKQVKFYIQSFIDKQNAKHGTQLTMDDYLKTETKGYIENRLNHAIFYIGTAGSKVGGRGDYATNIHFSEAAFYQDTELVTAEEMISATAQQVPLGKGKVFIESTANGEGNYYHKEWERAFTDKVSNYKPRFFGWELFYTEDQVEERRRDFSSDGMWKQEYPRTPEEAFRVTGSPFFDASMLQAMYDKRPNPIAQGRLARDGQFV